MFKFISLIFLTTLCSANLYAQDPYQYQNASPDRLLTFPKDHGSHPEFKTEWWYFTGQLYEENSTPFKDKPLFGYQLTFFRANNSSEQGYLAHAAITDFKNGTHTFHSLASPESYNFAGASADNLKVWNRNWIIQPEGVNYSAKFSLPNYADVKLTLSAKTPPVLQGNNGFSKKGSCDLCASHYISFPLMETSAQITFKSSKSVKLKGLSWMDHEFMSNSLSESQVGWDWFSIMLKDNRQLMLFRVRDKNPNNSFYSGSLIKTDSATNNTQVTNLDRNSFTLVESDYWTSPNTKAKYPNAWRITVPSESINLELKTRINNQELVFPGQKASSYYEGAISSQDESAIGYAELTGYSEPLKALSSLDR
jgi:predicted secreted hydrolase